MRFFAQKKAAAPTGSGAPKVSRDTAADRTSTVLSVSQTQSAAQDALQSRADRSPQVLQLAELQDRANDSLRVRQLAARRENQTGMPDQLKTGLEQLSGRDLSELRVHFNSHRPAQLNAHAFTQGKDIHIAPGQSRYLPHEGWHAVQQMEGRVRPTIQAHGVPINDHPALEREADVMGAKAVSAPVAARQGECRKCSPDPGSTLQRQPSTDVEDYEDDLSNLQARIGSIEEQETKVENQAISDGFELEEPAQRRAAAAQRTVVQRVLTFVDARNLLRRISRLAGRWQAIYQDLSSLIEEICSEANVSVSSVNLTTIVNHLKEHYSEDLGMTNLLNRIQGLVDDMEDLANRIDHLAGDVFRDLGQITGSQRDILDNLFEQIQDNISQE